MSSAGGMARDWQVVGVMIALTASPRASRIEVMLNTLDGERYARRALLASFVDEIEAELEGETSRHLRALLDCAARGELSEAEVDGLIASYGRSSPDAATPTADVIAPIAGPPAPG